mgnify:CR=1 FL=1
MLSMNKKKLTICMPLFQIGGGEVVLMTVMNWLVCHGWDVTLVLFQKKGEMLERLDKRVVITSLDASRFLTGFIYLIRYMRAYRPNVIMSSSMHSNVLVLLAKIVSRTNTKVILRVGSPLSVVFSKWKGRDKVIAFFTRKIYKKADKIIAVSKGIADDIVKVTNTPREKIVTIHNPKDVDFIRKQSEEYVPDVFKKNKGPFVLSVGRFTEAKDHPTLIKSFLQVRKKIKDLHLVLLGDGGDRGYIEKMVRAKNIEDCVSFEGYQENPYVYMKNADVFVLSSKWEGLPNVLSEALVCGMDIIATDSPMGGAREILAPSTDYKKRIKTGIEKGEYGFLIPVENIEQLSKSITTVLLGGIGFEKEHLIIENIFSKYEELIFNT